MVASRGPGPYRLRLLDGDGIGTEIVPAARVIVDAAIESVVAQAAHGSAADIAGRGIAGRSIANPAGMVLPAGMLFSWLSRRHGDDKAAHVARAIELGVRETITRGVATSDPGGDATTAEFTASVTAAVLGVRSPA